MRAEQLQKALATDADELRSLAGVPHATVAKKHCPGGSARHQRSYAKVKPLAVVGANLKAAFKVFFVCDAVRSYALQT